MATSKGKALRNIHAKLADELNKRNKATPKKYSKYLKESHNEAANHGYHLSEN